MAQKQLDGFKIMIKHYLNGVNPIKNKQELNFAILLKSQFHQMHTYMPSAVKGLKALAQIDFVVLYTHSLYG